MATPAQPKKQTQLLILGSFVMLIVMLSFVGMTTPPRPTRGAGLPGEALIALAALSAVASAAICFTKLRPQGQVGEVPVPPSPTRFQTAMLVALAFAEIPTLLGLVGQLQGTVPILPFTAVSLALMLGGILPSVLAHWNRAENP